MFPFTTFGSQTLPPMATPSATGLAFPLMTFPGPIVFANALPTILTPPRPFGIAAVPAASVPIRLPATVTFTVRSPEMSTPRPWFPEIRFPFVASDGWPMRVGWTAEMSGGCTGGGTGTG